MNSKKELLNLGFFSPSRSKKKLHLMLISKVYPYYYLRGFHYLGSFFFLFKNAHTLLPLSRDKVKGQFGKNTTLNPTKILPPKLDHFPLNFQIDLFTYKLDSQKKITYKKLKHRFFFFLQKFEP